MRGRRTWFAGGCLAVSAVLLGAVGGMSNAAEEVKAPLNGQPSMEKFQAVSSIVLDKCMACHSRDYDLPFYARIPGIKQIIEQDYRDGLRAMDLNLEVVEAARDKPIGETTLAKMEWVIANDTMPPAKFTVVHWGSKLSAQDKNDILRWVATSRAAHYATNPTAPRAYEPLQPLPDALPVNTQKAVLGETLFNDKRLSGDDTLSCASCHAINKAGTDNLRFAEGIRGQFGNINAPTVFNAVFNVRQFWDGRAADLQEQAGGPPMNPIEMGSRDWAQIIEKLDRDEALTASFKAVYPEGWSGEAITDAIAEYEKLLITPGSRFDKWLLGDDAALTADEQEGYKRFKLYRCSSCHVGKAVGGQSFEYMDLKGDYFAWRGDPLPSDVGLQGFTGNEADLHRFKVPTLRNVELTAPYLHDGTVTSLDEAVRVMGVYLSGLPVPDQDRALIVGFLRTLTGEFRGQPLPGTPVAK